MDSRKATNSKGTNLSNNKEESVQGDEAERSKSAIFGLDGLRPMLRNFQFTLDFNVFNSLVEATYRRISKADLEYSRNISMGMFSYYCGMALWYRLYAIKHAQGGDPEWWFLVLKSDLPQEWVLPKPICEFLDSVGDFIEPNRNVYWKFVFPALDKNGHFGKMSPDSFYKYMAYPAPAILVETLRRELDMTNGKVEPNCEWRLEGIDYENIVDERVFTENVCGYYVPPQASIYGISVDGPIHKRLSETFTPIPNPDPDNTDTDSDPDSENKVDGLIVCTNLIAHITEYNTNEISSYPTQKYSNESKYGSLVQMGFVEYSTTNGEEYLTSNVQVQGFSPIMLPSSIANLIPVFRLRIKRSSRVEAYPYDFKTLEVIPADWPENLNLYFDFGDAKTSGLNCGKFSTASIDGKRAVVEYVDSFCPN